MHHNLDRRRRSEQPIVALSSEGVGTTKALEAARKLASQNYIAAAAGGIGYVGYEGIAEPTQPESLQTSEEANAVRSRKIESTYSL